MRRQLVPAARLRRQVGLGGIAAVLAMVAGLTSGDPVAAAIHPGNAMVRTTDVPLSTAVNEGLGSGTVRCPDGTRAISGGAALHLEGQGLAHDFQAKLIGSGPLGSGRGWRGAAMSFDEARTILLRITVVCLGTASLTGYIVKTRDLGPDPGVLLVGSLGCGTGLRMVTGGTWWVGTPIYGAENLYRSIPSSDGRRWRAAGFTYGSDERLRLLVVCLPTERVGALAIRYRDYPGGGIADPHVGGGASCPVGQRALAGGAEWRVDGSSSLDGSLISTTVKLSSKGWYAAGDSAAPGVELRVLVTCIPA